jgi:PAS domain S-box-containing protein
MVGRGLVGGKCVSGKQQGATAANLAAEILAGIPASQLPVVRHSPNVFMFDQVEIKHHNLSSDLLPEESIIINQETSELTVAPGIAALVLGIFIFLAFMVIILIINARSLGRTKAAVAGSEQNYRAIFNSTNEAIFIHDANTGVIVDVNQSVLDMYHCTKEDILGRKIHGFGSANSRTDEQDALRKIRLAAENGPQLFEWLAQRKDGSTFWVEITLRRAQISGQPRVLAVVRDISHRKSLESQLRHSQKMEAVGKLAGGVAHDFNNLLQAILGHTEVALAQATSDDPLYPDLVEVRKATKRAADLTAQLLSFSRREPLKPVPLDMNDVVADLMKMLRRLLGEHITIELNTEDDLWPILADRPQIEQIIVNLCCNARDAMPGGGTVTLKTRNFVAGYEFCQKHPDARKANYVMISISDMGYGIPPEVLEHIFEPFYTTKELGKGTGLGLASVYAIVERNGGMIDVDSKTGKGTTFTIYLPACAQAISRSPAERTAPLTLPRTDIKATILIAEDEEAVRNLAVRILESAGYDVIAAVDGAEAIELFHTHREEIGLALLDVIMPKKNGREVFEAIKAATPELPVVFCSGYTRDTLGRDQIPDEIGEIMQKPYSTEALLSRVHDELVQAKHPTAIKKS